jgi:hypothetical protein
LTKNQNIHKKEKFIENINAFIDSCSTNVTGEYRSCPNGNIGLYNSCFTAMTLHYLGLLKSFSQEKRSLWADYILSYQNQSMGYFRGPEIQEDELLSPKHDFDHVVRHLTAIVIPTLEILGAKPKYPLFFMHKFLDINYLFSWLEKIDWKDAWLVGNDLLFVGQYLLYFRDIENIKEADICIQKLFKWLDSEMDPKTGLWGTNGYCTTYAALFGGYHQLLLYYYCNHPLPYAERTIDLIIELQHSDGGFHPKGGGGACEDVDAIDVLVNLFKRTGYRARVVNWTLKRSLNHLLKQQMPDGGFLYRKDTPFMLNGIAKTAVPPNQSHLFGTWFRVHTIALICQIFEDTPFSQIDWNFNYSCSMGWHRKSPLPKPLKSPIKDLTPVPLDILKKYFQNKRFGLNTLKGLKNLKANKKGIK